MEPSRNPVATNKALEATELIRSRMQVLRHVIEAVWAQFVIFPCLSISNMDHLEVANRTSVSEGT